MIGEDETGGVPEVIAEMLGAPRDATSFEVEGAPNGALYRG